MELVTFPLRVAVVAVAGVVGNGLAAPPATLSDGASVTTQLEGMLKSDQSGWWSGRFFTMPWRDEQRLARTRMLLESESELELRAQYAAAMLLQHGTEPSDFKRAHELATSASEGGFDEAEWLVKATYDRWQLSIGKPQKYGTQSKIHIGPGGIRQENP